MHRKRVKIIGRAKEGNWPILEIDMGPTKTNQFGEREDKATLVADGRHPLISAGVRILAMVAQDEVEGNQSQVLLFRDARTGKEMTERSFNNRLRDALRTVGLGHLATGGHGLRIGGASTVAEQHGGDEAQAAGG